MINFLEFDRRHHIVEDFLVVVSLVAWEEDALVVYVLNEGVSSVSVGLDGCDDNGSVLVGKLAGRRNRNPAVSSGVFVDGLSVLDIKGNIFDSITMINKVAVHLLGAVLVVHRAKAESCALVVPDHMACNLSLSILKPLVGQILEAKSGGIVSSSLLTVSDPEGEMS